jgi:uncharacterized protein YaaN involved in tellurite resistance
MTVDNQPPAPTDSDSSALVLTPPEPVAPVTPAQATAAVKLDPATEAKLDATVNSFVQSLTTLDVHSTDFQKKVDSVSAMGDADIRQSAQVSNNLLNKPVAAMSSGVFDPTSQVAGSLVKLRRTVEDLDPAKQGILHGTERKILGIIPFGNSLRDYFNKYQSGQANINSIIQALYSGQDALRKDNASIEQEKVNLWAVMQRLQQYDYMAKKMDDAVTAQVAKVQASDPDRAKILQQDVLFYVRQKDQDILTQLAVSVQGYLALDVIRRNNLELIKGVDRATTTTVSALRTAVIVAQALANQKLVLDQITALNTTTSNLIWLLYIPSGLLLGGAFLFYKYRSFAEPQDDGFKVSALRSSVLIPYENIRSVKVQPLSLAFLDKRKRMVAPMMKPLLDKPALFVRLRSDESELASIKKTLGGRVAYDDMIALPLKDADALSWEISSRLPDRLGQNQGGGRRRKRRR